MLDCVICDYFIEEPGEIAKSIGVCGPVCQEVLELRAEVERLREEVERLSREAAADDSLMDAISEACFKGEDLIEPLKRRGLWNFREQKDA